jgi:hypothetical protein
MGSKASSNEADAHLACLYHKNNKAICVTSQNSLHEDVCIFAWTAVNLLTYKRKRYGILESSK